MTDTQVTVIVAAVAPTLLALAAVITSLRTKSTVEVIKAATDGMKSDLVAAVGAQKQAEGQLKGTADEQARVKEDLAATPVVVENGDGHPVPVKETKSSK